MTYFDKSLRKMRHTKEYKNQNKELRIRINTMWHFMPMPYVIINTGSKYRLTFYVKQRQKRQPIGAAFFVCHIQLKNIVI